MVHPNALWMLMMIGVAEGWCKNTGGNNGIRFINKALMNAGLLPAELADFSGYADQVGPWVKWVNDHGLNSYRGARL